MLKEIFAYTSLLLQAQPTPRFPLAERVHAPVTLETRLQEPPTRGSGAYRSLITTAVATHIPLGIVFGHRANADLCSMPLASSRSLETVGDLIQDLKQDLPAYRVTLEGGVLNVMPLAMGAENKTEEFLQLVIPHFDSGTPKPMVLVSAELWGAARERFAPAGASGFAGSINNTAESVPTLRLENATVKTILNSLVNEGGGGIWTLKSSMLPTLSAETRSPFDVYSYVGEAELIKGHLDCSQ